jgi:Holliday junction resolvasome RuvABC endonuclease subunit
MVRIVLGLAVAPRPDAADALAAAITHLQRAPWLVEAQERQKTRKVRGL